jgi:hypothetical protein
MDETAVIVENSARRPLSATVGSLLEDAEHVRLAVGYLFVEGLVPLIGVLDAAPCVDLMIGNVVNRLTDEQLRESGVLPAIAGSGDEEFAANFRDARNRAATETALNLRETIGKLQHSSQNRDLLIAMANWIATGKLRVRLSTRYRLHAKVTIAEYRQGHPNAPGRAIMGTSNVTMPLASSALSAASNLDVLLQGKHNCDRLIAWFEHHWSEAQDFHRELFDVLGQTWPLGSP